MKTRILKLGMPVMAFLMAIAFAFASENVPSNLDETLNVGYIHDNGLCKPVSVDCDNIGSNPCTTSGVQVYTNSTCITKMFRL